MRRIKESCYSFTIIFSFAIVVILILSSCIKKKNYPQCGGFNDASFTLWFQYQVNQNLYFKSNASTSTIDTFKISVVNKSNPFQQSAFSSGDSCSSSIKIQAPNEKSGYDLSANYLKNQYYRGVRYNSLTLTIINSGWRFDGISDTGLILEDKPNIDVKAVYFKDLILNGSNFKDVQQLGKDSTKLPLGSIYKIWFAKNKGLIAFRYNGSQELWTLTN